VFLFLRTLDLFGCILETEEESDALVKEEESGAVGAKAFPHRGSQRVIAANTINAVVVRAHDRRDDSFLCRLCRLGTIMFAILFSKLAGYCCLLAIATTTVMLDESLGHIVCTASNEGSVFGF